MGGMKLRRHPDAAYKMIDGEAMIVLPSQGEVKVLNPIGSLVWDLMDGSRDLDAIVSRVCDEFEVDPDRARSDILEFLQQLQGCQMVMET